MAKKKTSKTKAPEKKKANPASKPKRRRKISIASRQAKYPFDDLRRLLWSVEMILKGYPVDEAKKPKKKFHLALQRTMRIMADDIRFYQKDLERLIEAGDAERAAETGFAIGNLISEIARTHERPLTYAGSKTQAGGQKAHKRNYPDMAEQQQDLARQWKRIKASKKDKSGEPISDHAADKAVAIDEFKSDRQYKKIERARKKYPNIELDSNP